MVRMENWNTVELLKTKISSPMIDYIKNEMIEGDYERIMKASNLDNKDLFFLKFPSKEEIKEKNILFSSGVILKIDLIEIIFLLKIMLIYRRTIGNEGTFTNFAQNDQILFQLHTYLMYLKFGFGRATQDAGIEIRRGAMIISGIKFSENV